jgi:hypothetical protein
MKASDIITQLAILLPQLTDKFTDDIAVASLTRSGTEITVQCEEKHGLIVGDGVAIVNSLMHIGISSLTRSGVVGTLVTSADHDLTNAIATTITISGSDEADFNGTFTRLNIVNRRTITFTMLDSGATTESGTPLLHNAESSLRQYNSTYRVSSVPSETVFTFNHATAGLADPTGDIIARVKPRISGAIQIDRALQTYTSQKVDKYWLFVTLDDVVASKGRAIDSDAVDNLQRGNEFRQQIIQPFTIYVFIPVQDEIAARESRDIASDLFRPICRSLLFSKFDSRLYVGQQGPVQFASHGIYQYDPAVYIHSFNFQQVIDITFEDTVGPDLDVALRNIDYTLDFELSDFATRGTLTGNVDLDDTPL